MRGEIVALDLETTGLDPLQDEIIEIGIAICQDDEIIEQYDTLVNPGRINIPPHVEVLTGITNDDVRDAPPIRELLPEIQRLVGNRPVLGHNVGFDLGMLYKHRIGVENIRLDTYELSSFLLPMAPRYNLNSLMQHFGLVLENAHRALDDALAAWQVYRKLWQLLLEIPFEILREIADLSNDLDWSAAPAVQDALRLRIENNELTGRKSQFANVFQPLPERGERLRRRETPIEVDVDDIAGILEPGGKLSQKMPGYESRNSQVEMCRAVTEAFNEGQHLIIEAPTGTGKSLAYLIPATHWAEANNDRVVVATHTLNLQDQLLDKDIPLLQNQLGLNIKATTVKGRGNYLCPRRLEAMRRRKLTNIEELRVVAKVLVWLSQGGQGTMSEINLRGNAEKSAWYRLTAQDEGCQLDRCRDQMHGTCPFFKARAEAESAHILITNHALLLSDVASGNRVLPEYNYLVLDEGHHLEDAITDGLLRQTDKYGMLRLLTELGDARSGLLGDMMQSLKDLPEKHYGKIDTYLQTMIRAVKMMGDHVRGFFDEIAAAFGTGRTDAQRSIRITEKEREISDWQTLIQRWEYLEEFFDTLSDSMRTLADGLTQLSNNHDIPNGEDTITNLRNMGGRIQELSDLFKEFLLQPQPNFIYWVDVFQESRQVIIKAAPLHVGELVERHIWESKECVVLTSATLRTANSFDFLESRLSAEHVLKMNLDSPFDYASSTMVYLPSDMPEPNHPDYQHAVERAIIETATATQGRMLCLFTSYSQLRETSKAITPRLALGDIIVYDQSSGTSRQLLLESFKTTEKAVLMGTRSFWEGVDVPGDDLSVVMIARLPFSVPSDPIFAARSETYGDKSFMEYSIPDAILRFRQGFGRLIRRQSDRGVVVILDKRVQSKRYGQLFIDSLPETTLQRGSLDNLPRMTEKWLDQ